LPCSSTCTYRLCRQLVSSHRSTKRLRDGTYRRNVIAWPVHVVLIKSFLFLQCINPLVRLLKEGRCYFPGARDDDTLSTPCHALHIPPLLPQPRFHPIVFPHIVQPFFISSFQQHIYALTSSCATGAGVVVVVVVVPSLIKLFAAESALTTFPSTSPTLNCGSKIPTMLKSLHAVSLGCAPTPTQYRAREISRRMSFHGRPCVSPGRGACGFGS
jgi:hypothetical protein